jgi:putative membrane protein insertion efficiency factor
MMKQILLALLRQYKRWISPVLPVSCRYVPTCSEYAVEAVTLHGAGRGSYLALRRLMRCHPFGSHGVDQVPQQFSVTSSQFPDKPHSKAV